MQAQYAYDRAQEAALFGDRAPCAMGKMILNVWNGDSRARGGAGGRSADDARAGGFAHAGHDGSGDEAGIAASLLSTSAGDDGHPVLGDNLYPYLHFADQQVLRHWLLTPVQHVPDLSTLRRISPAAWEAFHSAIDALRESGAAVFIHGGGSAAMSVAAHVHAHVMDLGEKLTHVEYDQDSGRVAIRAGDHWLVDTPAEGPAAAAVGAAAAAGSDCAVSEYGTGLPAGWQPVPWYPEPSACDDRYEQVIGHAHTAEHATVAQRREHALDH